MRAVDCAVLSRTRLPVDVPQVADALGIGVPNHIRSAAELPELHAPFTLGYVHQTVQVTLDRDVAGPHLFTVGRR